MKITPTQLAKRVEFWQRQLGHLGISHWTIEELHITDDMPRSARANAAIRPSPYYASATFWFNSEFLEGTDKYQLDVTIVHEWMHAAMRDLDYAIEAAEEHFPPSGIDGWNDRVMHAREALVEATARQIVALHYASKA